MSRSSILGWIVALVGCKSVPPSDLTTLADDPPAPYSVIVSGGAFIEESAGAEALDRTFGAADAPAEALSLRTIVGALETAHTFVRVMQDDSDAGERAMIASLRSSLAVDEPAADGLFTRASGSGHDYVLVIERVVDGPVTDYGINTRWPITLTAWLMIALGMVIPDHTFESGASLHVALRDAHSGATVYRRTFDAETIDLALVDRGSLLGIIASIIVPPFWIPNDDEAVVEEVRRATRDRLLFLLAQDLKGNTCRDELIENAAAVIEVEELVSGGSVAVTVRARDGLSFIELTLDGETVVGEAFDGFREAFFAGAAYDPDGVTYAAKLQLDSRLVPGAQLQVLVQTNSGRVASTTIAIDQAGER